MNLLATKLAEAVRCADVDLAKEHLRRLIETEYGGELETKMAASKAWRAEGFAIVDGAVYFTIERHPGLHHWLLHRVQTWEVTLEGSVDLVSEEMPRLTLESLAEPPGKGERALTLSLIRQHAEHAWAYADAVLREDLGSCDSDAEFVLAWTYLASRSPTRAKWCGRGCHIIDAARAHFAVPPTLKEASAVNREAALLWDSNVRAPRFVREAA